MQAAKTATFKFVVAHHNKLANRDASIKKTATLLLYRKVQPVLLKPKHTKSMYANGMTKERIARISKVRITMFATRIFAANQQEALLDTCEAVELEKG